MAAEQTPQGMAQKLQALGVEYVLVEGDSAIVPKARELVESASDAVANYGTASLRRWKSEYRFAHELLINPRFQDETGWSFSQPPRLGEGRVVTVQGPASQSVPVQPARRYLNEITVVCPRAPALARAQVNWISSAGEFLKADIRVVECGPQPSTYRMEVIAPGRAAVATVYASGHTEAPVEFKANSFRR
jgi:hypothetical protein